MCVNGWSLQLKSGSFFGNGLGLKNHLAVMHCIRTTMMHIRRILMPLCHMVSKSGIVRKFLKRPSQHNLILCGFLLKHPQLVGCLDGRLKCIKVAKC